MERVNHPSYYQGQNECIEVMKALFGAEAVKDFCRCNSFKYRFRAGAKDMATYDEDIKKAEWYENYLMMMEGIAPVEEETEEIKRFLEGWNK
jgi:hypothetical protein